MTLQEIVDLSKASQNKLELIKLLTYVSEIKPEMILEIGVHQGYSLEIWYKAFPKAQIIGVEKDMHDYKSPFTSEEIRVTNFIGDSHDAKTLERIKLFLKKPVDFLFLDGDHTYEGVKKDFEMYAPLVRKGGIIAFHDIMLNSNEWRMAGVDVQRFWIEVIGKTGSKYYEFWDQLGKGTGTGLWYKS